jgi:hypothetical protein
MASTRLISHRRHSCAEGCTWEASGLDPLHPLESEQKVLVEQRACVHSSCKASGDLLKKASVTSSNPGGSSCEKEDRNPCHHQIA